MTYPEHDKLHKAKEELGTEHVGQFLEWLEQDGLILARFHDHERNCDSEKEQNQRYAHRGENGRFYSHPKNECLREDDVLVAERMPIMQLLARYAGIDLAKLDEEKRAMLDEVRALRKGG
jgi:hypothetical protein